MQWYVIYLNGDTPAKKGPYNSFTAAKKDYKKVRSCYKSIMKTSAEAGKGEK